MMMGLVILIEGRENDVRRGRGIARGCGGGVCRGCSDSGQGVGVGSVVSQARSRGGDGGRRGRAATSHAGRVMVQRTLIILLVMMIGHVVHGTSRVRARVHAVVMMMSRWRGMRVRMMRRAEIGVALMQLLVHFHLRWLDVLRAWRCARRRARQ